MIIPLRRSVYAGATAILLAGPVSAQQEGDPFARARLDPGSRVTVGQPLRITVEVLVPSFFTGGPRFPALDVSDALTVFEDRGTNFTERMGRRTFAGQRRAFVVYPQRPGSYRIEAIPVTVPYRDETEGPTTATVSPPPIVFEAVLPPEAEGLSYFIATTRLSLRATYDQVPDTMRVGDAFTRTVTATVQDALAMVVPPMGVDSIPGLAIYSDPPLVDDEGGERGERIVGTRSESFTFVALEEGEYEVSGLEIHWWDVNAGRMRTATVDPISFAVLPALTESAFGLEVDSAEVQAAAAETSSRFDVMRLLRRFGAWLLGTIAVLWLGVWVWRRHGRRWLARWEAAKAAKAESEETYFRKFREKARRGDPLATLRALTVWYDRARRPGDSAALSDWVTSVGEADLVTEYEGLLHEIYGSEPGSATWDASRLLTALARGRKKAGTEGSARARYVLPPLNPTGP